MKQRVHVADSFWCGDDVNIVQEGEQPFTLQQLVLDCLQSRVLPQGEKEWHQHITLLTTFSLFNVVNNANVVFPQICGMIAIEHSHERQDLRTNLLLHQSLHHCTPGDEVKRAHPIDGHNRGTRIPTQTKLAMRVPRTLYPPWWTSHTEMARWHVPPQY